MSNRVRSKKVLAIDWNTRTLRVVHAQVGKRGVKIDRVFCVAIPADVDPANPEQMGRHIRRALDQEDISTRHAVVDIPRDQAILNTLTLPIAAPEELPGMVEIQVAKELPFPVSEAVIDYAVAPPEGGAVTADVLVAAIRHEVLEQCEATFTAAGLRLDRIGFRPYANKVAACELLKHAMPERVLFIDVRPTMSEINFLRNGALEFSRAAPVAIPMGPADAARFLPVREGGAEAVGIAGVPAGDETAAAGSTAEVIRSLVIEVRRSIEAYRTNDPGAKIDHVVIGGDLGIEESLSETIQQELQVTTEIYNPASSFGWEPDEGASASAFASTLGLVLTEADQSLPHFDFLHPKKVESVTQQRLKKAPLVAAVAVLFIAAGWVGLHESTKKDRAELADIGQRIEELEENVKDNKKFLRLVEDVKQFDEQYIWVDVLRDVITSLPSNEELVLNHVSVNQKDGQVVLKTRTKELDTASEVIRTLEEFRREDRDQPRFKVIMPSQSEKGRGKYRYTQELRVEILADGSGRTERPQRAR